MKPLDQKLFIFCCINTLKLAYRETPNFPVGPQNRQIKSELDANCGAWRMSRIRQPPKTDHLDPPPEGSSNGRERNRDRQPRMLQQSDFHKCEGVKGELSNGRETKL